MRRTAWWAAVVILLGLLVLLALAPLGSCAVGFRTDELGNQEPIIGIAAGGRSVARAAEGILGAIGLPEAAAGGLAGLVGIAAAYFRGTHRGERRGWDEAAATYQQPPSVPVGRAADPDTTGGAT